MDFSLNSSVVLAAVVGLWLIWVAPYLLRLRQPIQASGIGHLALSSTATGDSGFQRSVMNMSTTESPTTVAGASAVHTKQSSATTGGPSGQAFRIRWGRLGIAAAGAVAMLAALVTSVLAVVGLVPSVVPVLALLAAIACVAVLRFLAVRGRRRVSVPERTAASSSSAPAQPEVSKPQRPTALFNAEEAAGEGKAADDDAVPVDPAPPAFTAAELRAAALAVAAEAGDKSIGTGTPWQPVEVPKPTYVEAPKAERQEPAPLDLPEAPKPQAKTPLKNSAVAPKVEASSAPRLNLDEVLQRRRA
ncbi:hypothetical protein GC088_10900 [Arthrobacter sp. JZ12]|uniref:hypothetical protein n=1 Tax=Arthrobacter sp. JZ12 TaxID=2654190 RepID=UPI002B482052|nr:hypothetical protein [Arthrobacter sp. JZ12]WRH25522.1 hypothetical protein GC088_10900 [Arthrobacter sp. JZ12]